MGCDPRDGLSVEEQQRAGDPIWQGFAVTGQQFSQPGDPLVLGDGGGGAGAAVVDQDGGVDPRPKSPDEERPDAMAGGWSTDQPFIDVVLVACRGDAAVCLEEPVQELDCLGNLLFRRVDRTARRGSGGRDGADPPKVVLRRELLDGLPHGGRADGIELDPQPVLEAGEIGVAFG